MADFAIWITACEKALGWSSGSFMEAYDTAKHDLILTALETEVIAEPLLKLAEQSSGGWMGSATELLKTLDEQEGLEKGGKRRYEGWPRSPESLAKGLRRLAPVLSDLGLEIYQPPRSGKERKRIWSIKKIEEATVLTVRQAVNPVLDNVTPMDSSVDNLPSDSSSTVPSKTTVLSKTTVHRRNSVPHGKKR